MHELSIYPTGLSLSDDNRLVIDWNDHVSSRIPFKVLRDNCPCAHCREAERNPPPAELLPVISTAEAQPMMVVGVKPLGNYAYTIAFSDGHDTGIYKLELLRRLGDAVAEAES
ncbi:MAG: hypothetical protein CMJ76_17055 [Planctomycetaceae bacterium]|nr:hypothetical protein [Planctomycetaceae bacterium]|tara:strand:- start:623 stop:961 length:339 start_codon:yes stop_codon:yes gene_type:complete